MTTEPDGAALRAKDVLDWALRRSEDLFDRELDNSLFVSKDKPLGSMRVHAESLFGAIRLFWRHRRVIWHIRKHRDIQMIQVHSPTGLWWYAWHDSLQDLLDRHAVTLEEEDWPTDAHRFIESVRMVPVAPLTPLYGVIAAAYGDTMNPGLPEVLPGHERSHLFAVFSAMNGISDPAQTFFELAKDGSLLSQRGIDILNGDAPTEFDELFDLGDKPGTGE